MATGFMAEFEIEIMGAPSLSASQNALDLNSATALPVGIDTVNSIQNIPSPLTSRPDKRT
jgi:hypothetical protein